MYHNRLDRYTQSLCNNNINSNTNSHIVHCTRTHTHTMESAIVKTQNTYHSLNNITCSTDYEYRTATTVCTVETGFASSI